MGRRVKPEWVAVVLTIVTMLVGGAMWAGHVQARDDSQDRAIAAVEQTVKEHNQQLRDDVAYIRRRLDEYIDGVGR